MGIINMRKMYRPERELNTHAGRFLGLFLWSDWGQSLERMRPGSQSLLNLGKPIGQRALREGECAAV